MEREKESVEEVSKVKPPISTYTIMLSAIPSIIAIIGIVIAYAQLSSQIESNSKSLEELRRQNRLTIEIASDEVADEYLRAPQLINAKKIINDKTNYGKDYSGVAKDPILELAVLSVLNFLETTATKVIRGRLDEEIVKDHLDEVIKKQVEVHILGTCPTGVDVATSKRFASSEFKSLFSIYSKWWGPNK